MVYCSVTEPTRRNHKAWTAYINVRTIRSVSTSSRGDRDCTRHSRRPRAQTDGWTAVPRKRIDANAALLGRIRVNHVRPETDGFHQNGYDFRSGTIADPTTNIPPRFTTNRSHNGITCGYIERHPMRSPQDGGLQFTSVFSHKQQSLAGCFRSLTTNHRPARYCRESHFYTCRHLVAFNLSVFSDLLASAEC